VNPGWAGDLGTDCSSTLSKPEEKQNIRCRKSVGSPALRELPHRLLFDWRLWVGTRLGHTHGW